MDAFDFEIAAPSATLLVPRAVVHSHGVNVFECPTCRNRFRYDDEYGPVCTGPHPSLDEHEPTLMVKIDGPQVVLP